MWMGQSSDWFQQGFRKLVNREKSVRVLVRKGGVACLGNKVGSIPWTFQEVFCFFASAWEW